MSMRTACAVGLLSAADHRRRNCCVGAAIPRSGPSESFGMLGRLPDFCAAMIVGIYDTRAELNALHAGFGDNAARYLKFARQNDLALSHGLHDPHMDKTLRPQAGPGSLPAHRA